MKYPISLKKSKQDNLVSIIIPTHNRADYIKATLESASNQTYKDLEIIVVDDHSSDETKKVVNDYIIEGHNNILLFDSDGYGACRARNLGLERSRGAYIQFFDDDDIMCPDYIKTRLEFLKNNELDYVSCDFDHFSGSLDNVIYERKISATPHNIVAHLYHMNLPTQCFLLKREAIEKLGGWDERVKRLQDMAYFHRLYLYNLTGDYLSDVLYKYRIHNNTITKRFTSEAQIRAFDVIAKEWKAEGKYDQVEKVLMLGKYNFLRKLLHESRMKFLKQAFLNFPIIVRMQWYYRVLKKDDASILNNCI